jgi:hypothetical protein
MKRSLLSMLFFLFFADIHAQFEADTTYFENYRDELTTRFYTSRKYTSLLVRDQLTNQSYRFEPNSTLNLGVGVTYDDFTLNLAYGFGFMNPERGTGQTSYLDLQAHMYPSKFVIDFFGQFYTGYYLLDDLRLRNDVIFVLPEMQVTKLGLNVQYLLNGERLSLKAAFLQSAWQKKSAGSLVVGVEAYGSRVANDGLILPSSSELLESRNFDRIASVDFGPNLGYVHTLVFAKHFFLTGMVSASLAVNRLSMDLEEGRVVQWGISPNLFWRGFIGYNGRLWSINANYVQNSVRNQALNAMESTFLVGNYRLNFVYRIVPGPKLRSKLDVVSPRKVMERLKK